MHIRSFEPADVPALIDLTIAAFQPCSRRTCPRCSIPACSPTTTGGGRTATAERSQDSKIPTTTGLSLWPRATAGSWAMSAGR